MIHHVNKVSRNNEVNMQPYGPYPVSSWNGTRGPFNSITTSSLPQFAIRVFHSRETCSLTSTQAGNIFTRSVPNPLIHTRACGPTNKIKKIKLVLGNRFRAKLTMDFFPTCGR